MAHTNGRAISDDGQPQRDPASLAIELLGASDTLVQWLALCLHKRSYSGVSLAQVHAFHLIHNEEAIIAEISRRRYVVASVITGVIDRLERDGFLKKNPDPLDRRAFRLEITETGFRAYVDALGVLEEEFSEVLAGSGIDPGELEITLLTLRKITSNLPPMAKYYQ